MVRKYNRKPKDKTYVIMEGRYETCSKNGFGRKSLA